MKKYLPMWPLFLVQFFTWLGLFSLWIYATPAIAKSVFGTEDPVKSVEEGTRWVGVYFAVYSLLGASLTFLLHKILRTSSKYLVHAVALLIGGLGLVSMYFVHSRYLLLLSFVFVGVAWSSISTVPYLLVGELAPEEGSENFYAVFNFSTVIPQATAAFLLAFLTKAFFGGDMLRTIAAGGVFMLVAAAISCILHLIKSKKTEISD